MGLSIAVLAEGSRETGVLAIGPAPANLIPVEQYGPAHILVRRILAEDSVLPSEAVHFIEPIRGPTGLVARGSQLRDKSVVRRLVTGWAPGTPRPDLFVLLVDADGEPDRGRELEEWTAGLGAECVVGVAVQEFEAWLVADSRAVQNASGADFPTTPDPERMAPRRAKQVLEATIARSGKSAPDVRRTIANLLDLAAVSARCRAFDAFRTRLRAAVPA